MQELAGKRNIRTANATLKGREEECVINSLDASYVLFKKVLQLFMTELMLRLTGTFSPLAPKRPNNWEKCFRFYSFYSCKL